MPGFGDPGDPANGGPTKIGLAIGLGVAVGDPNALAAGAPSAVGLGVAVGAPAALVALSGGAVGLGVAVGGGASLQARAGVAVGIGTSCAGGNLDPPALAVGLGIALGDGIRAYQGAGGAIGLGIAVGGGAALQAAGGGAVGIGVGSGDGASAVTTTLGSAVGLGVALGDGIALVTGGPGAALGLGMAVGDPAALQATSGGAVGLGIAVGGGASLQARAGVAVGIGGALETSIPLGIYEISIGDHTGGPIDYTIVVAWTAGLSIDMPALPLNSQTWYGLRKHDLATNLVDQNTDAQVRIDIGMHGEDVTNVPFAPTSLRGRQGANASAVIEWTYRVPVAARFPTGFHIYMGPAPIVSYTTPVGTVLFDGRGVGNLFAMTGLTDGLSYSFSVRAFNAHGEELNTAFVTVTADATPPDPVQDLTATLVR